MAILRLEKTGEIPEGDSIYIAMSLLIASMDNTIQQLGLTMGTLLRDRSRWEQVLAKLNSAAQAAEETYRLCPRFNMIQRHTSTQIQVEDFTFPPDSWVWIATRSGSRDETKFEAPAEFRMDRRPTKALMFGAANYSCLGATLARLEVNETLRIIADRFPGIAMIGHWEPEIGPIVSECHGLRVRFA